MCLHNDSESGSGEYKFDSNRIAIEMERRLDNYNFSGEFYLSGNGGGYEHA